MNALIHYIFVSSCTLFIAVGLYALLFRKLSFFKLNRLYLQAVMGFSVGYPLLMNFWQPGWLLESHAPINLSLMAFNLNQAPVNTTTTAEVTSSWPSLSTLILMGIGLGILVFLCRFLKQLYTIYSIKKDTDKISIHQVNVLHTKQTIAPFSFYKSIILNKNLYDETALKSIINHEHIHVQQKHYIDIFLSEAFKIIFWFNPCSWLLTFFIRENIEHQTDALVLNSGQDAKAYQYHLLRVSTDQKAKKLSINFNYQHLKNRIKMMNKKPTSKLALSRYILAIAIILPALFLQSNTSYAQKKSAIPKVKVNLEDTYNPAKHADTIVYVVNGEKISAVTANALSPSIIESINVLKGADAYQTHNIPKEWIGPKTQGVVVLTTKDKQAAITFKDKSSLPKNVLYIVNGEKSSQMEIEKLPTSSIKSIKVLKNKKALKKWNTQNKNGVIIITTK